MSRSCGAARPQSKRRFWGEVQRRGRYALPQDLAVKLYQNMIYEMLNCVQTVARHSIENERRNS